MVPENFETYWNLLKKLMKPEFQQNEPLEYKEKLYSLVVTRDTIGECMWFLYTGLLIISIVQLNINTRGCVNNTDTMIKNYDKFLEQEEKSNQIKEKNNSQVYTLQ
jgi:hypothetical protein